MFTHLLGDFASVNATSAILYPLTTSFDQSGTPISKDIPVTAPDHYAFAGILQSGAVASVSVRAGYGSTPGRRQFLWEIDGEIGSIRMQSDELGGGNISMKDPEVWLDGERVEVEGSRDTLLENLKEEWKEFASGNGGGHATLEDAVRNRRILDAIERSAKEGVRVNL